MEKTPQYDCTVIGAGPGGYTAAIKAAHLGFKTAIVEKGQTLGGTCLNVGCIPSKALLSSTEPLLSIEQWARQGISFSVPKVDLNKLMEWKSQAVLKLTSGVDLLMKNNKIDVYYGEAFAENPHEILVHRESHENLLIHTKSLILATGSLPVELPNLAFDGEYIIHSTHALSLKSVPKDLVIVGAGPIGLELGSVWSRLGSNVRVIEIMKEILPGWDTETASGLRKTLIKQGIEFFLETRILESKIKDGAVTLTGLNSRQEEVSFTADKVLVAAGRKSYTPLPLIENLGIKRDEKGKIITSSSFRTSAENVYAVGDCIQGPMLAHKAEEEGVACAEILAGNPGLVNYDAIPGVVYTFPEAAFAGKTEDQLKKEGVPFRKGRFFYRANGKAIASGHITGTVKVLSHEKTDRVLGVHIFGAHSDILISEGVTVMEFEGSAEDMGRMVHAHPTLSEIVKEAALSAYDRPIHGF